MTLYQLVFYVPESHVDVVKQAVFTAGGGRFGCYDSCCWQVLGRGQFTPLEGSSPLIGQTEVLEQVPEYRVELVVAATHKCAVIDALRSAHPYEEPAFSVWALEN